LNDFIQILVIHKRKERALKRSYERWENKISSLSTVRSHFKTMFKNAVYDSSNTKRGLNN
jgi:hypothetical protein